MASTKKEKIKGVKVTVSHDQRTITSEQVEISNDDLIVIMPKTHPGMIKRKLFWFATILYRYWD